MSLSLKGQVSFPFVRPEGGSQRGKTMRCGQYLGAD